MFGKPEGSFSEKPDCCYLAGRSIGLSGAATHHAKPLLFIRLLAYGLILEVAVEVRIYDRVIRMDVFDFGVTLDKSRHLGRSLCCDFVSLSQLFQSVFFFLISAHSFSS